MALMLDMWGRPLSNYHNGVYVEPGTPTPEEARATATANEAATSAAQGNAYVTGKNNAFIRTFDQANQSLINRGLDPTGYQGIINDALLNTYYQVPHLDENPASYFTNEVVDNALGRYRDDTRTKYSNQVSQTFTPGYAENYFSDKADDPFVQSVIGQQRGDATSYLDRAKSRGMLDDTGYAAGMARIGELDTQARSQGDTIGNAVVNSYRGKINDVAGEARSGAQSWDLGQNWDLGYYTNKASGLANTLQGTLGGDVRTALEGQSFFDVSDLIERGGRAQGATNPVLEGTDAIAAAMLRRNARRGVGSSGGVF